ncbi:uncharacterized protein LOC123193898 [Mangifera indica]|uniref:uncharacterized protein LOC123193898 n=1 Tax=Mangifera indica TaxID=29780 RepID=UPI001CFA43FE|nr:uncharacterized protein LOC123193898 [Mangifera indica]
MIINIRLQTPSFTTHTQNKQREMSQQHHRNSSFTACFFLPTNADEHPSAPPPPPPPPPISGKLNLTTCLYNTNLGVFSLTWSKTFLGHSLHLNLHPYDFTSSPLSDPSALSFHLHIKPFIFWKKHGSKNLVNNASVIQIFWDLSRARFGSGPEPQSGFFIAVVVDREIALLVGDSTKEACAKTKAEKKPQKASQVVLRREHVFGNNKVYNTRVEFGGKRRQISIDCSVNSDAKLTFSVDDKRVLQIKRLKWKFRGNERIEVDGVPIQVSWDVYNWLFEDMNGRAVFMFKFENLNNREEEKQQNEEVNSGHSLQQGSGFGMSGIEWRKMRKSLMRTARSSSSSSISMSSASSSGCSSSVMEWAASTEDNEFSSGPNGFLLLIYVWKK